VVWDEGQMRRTYHRLLHDDLGEAEGVLSVDESGCPKTGRESVGVARQSGGSLVLLC
jgi:SRSO17 transposase